MASFRIEVSATAEKQIRKLPRKDQVRVLQAIRPLASAPHPPGSRKVRGYDDVFRIRVGTYRILYRVWGRRLVIIILKIGHRREIYRSLR
ncbi:MAG: type II toxin-antitoxin system RelE/ParE family toxin [Acidobacteria bacterium]|nr:MAG: type II toxin-antitoxin system RelE/ParE family toxin [Acidobacteriota bacterium]